MSWKDAELRAEQAEAERDQLKELCDVKGKAFALEHERAEKAEARVKELEDAIVCFGTGDGDNGISEAYGEIIDREESES